MKLLISQFFIGKHESWIPPRDFFNMQKKNDYIEEKFRIYEEHLFLPGKNIKIQKKRIIS